MQATRGKANLLTVLAPTPFPVTRQRSRCSEAGLTPQVLEDDEEPAPHLLEGPTAREALPAPPAGPADQETDPVQGAAEPGGAVAGAAGGGASADSPAERRPGRRSVAGIRRAGP